jgi:hypothetical protein
VKDPADVVVSVKEQKLAIYNGKSGSIAKEYPISTSKFGLGDKPGTYGTPLGLCEVVAKIGHGAPSGAVFKSRHWTGEVIKPDSPGRDPIVSRIMWLRGMESTNKNAYARCIYIHGTAEERNIGKPVSYGCIRMKSKDVIELFNRLPIGSRVLVTKESLPPTVPVLPAAVPVKPEPSSQPPIFLEPQQNQRHPAEDRPLLAENTPKKHEAKTESSTDTEEAPSPARSFWRRKSAEPEPAAVVSEAPPLPPPPPQRVPSGGSVIYSAPATGGPGLVLKSKRTASQGYQNDR